MTKIIERVLIVAVAAAAVVWAAREMNIRGLETMPVRVAATSPTEAVPQPPVERATNAAAAEGGSERAVRPISSLVGKAIKVEQAPPDDFLARLKDPKRQDYVKAGLVAAMDAMYAPLFRCYQIGPDQMAYLKYLLAEKKAAENEFGARMITATSDEKAVLLRERDAATAEQDAVIRGFLGDEAFELYEGYERSLAERMMLKDLKDELASKDMPFTYEQEDAIIRMMYEERMNSPDVRDLLGGDAAAYSVGEMRGRTDAILRSYDAMIQRVGLRSAGLLDSARNSALTNHLARTRLMIEAAMAVVSNLTDEEIAAAAAGGLE